jgi:hypothetical protein
MQDGKRKDSTTASKKKFDVWILDFVDRHLLSRVDLAYLK